jgi:predicted extracellular nuclease
MCATHISLYIYQIKNTLLTMRSALLVAALSVFAISCANSNTMNNSLEEQGSNDTSDKSKVATYHVGFYNVENLFDTEDDPDTSDEWFLPTAATKWDDTRYQKKLNDLAKVIDAMSAQSGGPDFLGLAEVENLRVVKDLASMAALSANNYEAIHYNSPDTRGIDVAAIYNSKKFKLVESRSIEVPMPEDPAVKTRDILFCKLQVRESGVFFYVYVNHWSSRRDGPEQTFFKRENCAEALLNDMEINIPSWEKQPIIIMGDLNDYPTDKSIYEVLGAKEPTANAKLINLQYNNHAEGLGTYLHDGKWGCIDHIIVTRAMYDHAFTKDAKILKEDWMLYFPKNGEPGPNKTYGGSRYYGGYSDHLPVWFSFEL